MPEQKIVNYKETALAKLREIGATDVAIGYSGGGDDGQIDTVIVNNGEARIAAAAINVARVQVRKGKQVAGEWITYVDMEDKTLEWVLEQYAYEVLERLEYDWVNNEGGFGELKIEMAGNVDNNGVACPRIWVEHNQRVESTEYHEQEY